MSLIVNSHTNLQAYATAESIDSFSSIEEIGIYRSSRLAKYQPVVDFIARRLEGKSAGLEIAEIGSGSSALLYALENRNLLKHGCGIELSQSRFNFAELWKSEDRYSAVVNINRSFTEVDFQSSSLDWFVVIDNTFTYLHPVNVSYPQLLLERAFDALRAGGRIMLDFFNYSKRVAGVELQQWNIFPKTDPFSYGLYSHKIENGINTSKTIFVRRDTCEEQIKIELCKVYSLEDICQLIGDCGFLVEEVFCNFKEEPYLEESSERLVVIARRPLVE